jgi:protein phosphatase
VVSGDRLHLAGAGLCRAYILRGGRLAQVTRDDSLRNDYLAHIAAGGHTDIDLSEIPPNIITKALGLKETVDLRPSTFELCAGDVVLLCSDGLHGPVDEPSIARVLLDLTEPAEAALALVNLANARGGADNVAVVVARPETDGMRRPGPEDALESRNIP